MTGFVINILDGFDQFGEIRGQKASVCVFSTEVTSIASSSDLVFPVPTFDTLNDVKSKIREAVCSDIVSVKNVCEQSAFINGLYLYPDAKYCYIFHQCTSRQSKFSYPKSCPIGLFFDATVATCRRATAINCQTDPCKQGIADYPNHLTCSSFFVCSAGRTIGEECCEPGRRYHQGQGCIVDSRCTTPCPPTPSFVGCDLIPYPQDTTKYKQRLVTGAWKTRHCAPGTSFNAPDCRCSWPAALPAPSCKHELYLPFDINLQDIKLRKQVKNKMVIVVPNDRAIGQMAAQFNGRSQLLVSGYSNAWWGATRVFRLRFQETHRTDLLLGEEEVLFCNGVRGDEGSISVSYDRSNNSVKAKIATTYYSGPEMITRLTVSPVSRGAWKDVELWYDGYTVRLTVDNLLDLKPANAPIATRSGSLQIGSGCDAKNFAGYIDEFYVFRCIPL